MDAPPRAPSRGARRGAARARSAPITAASRGRDSATCDDWRRRVSRTPRDAETATGRRGAAALARCRRRPRPPARARALLDGVATRASPARSPRLRPRRARRRRRSRDGDAYAALELVAELAMRTEPVGAPRAGRRVWKLDAAHARRETPDKAAALDARSGATAGPSRRFAHVQMSGSRLEASSGTAGATPSPAWRSRGAIPRGALSVANTGWFAPSRARRRRRASRSPHRRRLEVRRRDRYFAGDGRRARGLVEHRAGSR